MKFNYLHSFGGNLCSQIRKNVCAASGDTFDITLFLEASSIALSRSLARRPIMLDPALPVTEFSALSCYAIYYQPMAGVLTA